MVFIVSLSAAAAMADDGILQTNRASAQDEFRTNLGPIGFEVPLRGRKRDKQNRIDAGFPPPVSLSRSCDRLWCHSPPQEHSNWKRISLRDGATQA